MGVVFLAEQQEPISRQAALKIIKPGIDTAEVIVRFEAEPRALDLRDHLRSGTFRKVILSVWSQRGSRFGTTVTCAELMQLVQIAVM
jgi:hypothetical protein